MTTPASSTATVLPRDIGTPAGAAAVYLPLPSGTPQAGQVPVATGAGEAAAWGGVLHTPVSPDPVQSRALDVLDQFTRWLSRRPGARGYIGEVGWPGSVSGKSDYPSWAGAGETWYRAADDCGMWVTYFAVAAYGGESGLLNAYYPTAPGNDVSVADPSIAPILEAHATYGRVLRGVNASGLEWTQGGFSNAAPGVYGTDFHGMSAASFSYLYSRGVRLVRIPFRWERVQPTLGAALDATQWGHVTAVVSAARSAGLYVVLDVHNFGAYTTAGGPQYVSTSTAYAPSTVSAANFADLWTRISAVYASDPGVFYGLMNEPFNIPAGSGTFTVTDSVSTFEDAAVDGWTDHSGGHFTLTAPTTKPHTGTHSLQLAFDGGTAFPAIGYATTVNPVGTRFGTWLWIPSALSGSYCTIQLQFATGAQVFGETCFPVYNTWNLVECDIPSSLAGVGVTQVTVSFASMPAVAANIYMDDAAFGSGRRTGTPGAAWEQISQQAVNAIRANSDYSLIMVSLSGRNELDHVYGPWIEDRSGDTGNWDGIRYERHIYFDHDNSGNYLSSYASEITTDQASGYSTPY